MAREEGTGTHAETATWRSSSSRRGERKNVTGGARGGTVPTPRSQRGGVRPHVTITGVRLVQRNAATCGDSAGGSASTSSRTTRGARRASEDDSGSPSAPPSRVAATDSSDRNSFVFRSVEASSAHVIMTHLLRHTRATSLAPCVFPTPGGPLRTTMPPARTTAQASAHTAALPTTQNGPVSRGGDGAFPRVKEDEDGSMGAIVSLARLWLR